MSTTVTKPVLLDETGQRMASALEKLASDIDDKRTWG